MIKRPRKAPEGFRYVGASRDEVQAYRDTHNGKSPPRNVPRVACLSCLKHLWGSGIAIGSHRRACPGGPQQDLA